MSYFLVLTKPQRHAVARITRRMNLKREIGAKPVTYKQIRRTVQPGPGCILLPFAGMWLGIEPDGYTHS